MYRLEPELYLYKPREGLFLTEINMKRHHQVASTPTTHFTD
jgi:hypothetical protein